LIEKLQRLSNTQSLDNSTAIETQDVVIAGGGPAGISAAIYAARKGFKVTLIAQTIGGQLKDTMGIENFISVPKTTGPELSTALQKHMNTYGITVKQNLSVSSIEDNDLKRTILTSGEVIESKTLIIATGAQWRKLNLPGEEENIGNGVAYCPHCDGPFFKGKDVAVIGGGNSGLEASIDLSGIANSVTVFEFLDELKADQVLIDRAGTRDNIKIKTGVETTQIISSANGVSGIEYRERGSGDIHTQTLSGIFVQIGLVPNSSFVENVVDTNSYGEIIIDDSGNTSAKGIFACGDVTTVPHKQIIISMGDGAKAAIAAADYLQS
jgi:alkyl hydroperoxide reductase subunit F